MPLHSRSPRFPASRPLALAASLTLCASSLAACGGGEQDGSAGAGPDGRLAASSAQTKPSGGTQTLPTDSEIKAAQKKAIKPAESGSDAARELPEGLRDHTVTASSLTAPEEALRLAPRAARAWLVYRVNGKAPDSSVVPTRVWKGVPPMVPTERVKGAALTGGIRVYEAHPEGDGWSVNVSTRDPRVPVVRLQLARSGGTIRVTEING